MKTFAIGVSVLALGLGIVGATPARAAEAYGDYVERIDLSQGGGINVHILLKNTSANKHVDAVKVAPASGTMEIPLDGHVKCEKDKDTNYDNAKAYFGTVSLFVDEINPVNVLYEASFNPSNTTWNGVGNGKWVTEAGDGVPFTVPLAQIKQGHPALRLDPVAEMEKKLQTHLNQGKSKAEFYQKDQFVEVERPITLAGWCRKTISFSQAVSKAGYKTIMAKLTIRYEGDPAVTDAPKLNAQMQGNMPNAINQDLPMQLVEATFQPNMPHYIGKCMPDQDPKIRVNYKGSGKGTIRFMVEDNSSPVYSTQDIPFDSANGPAFFDFNYPLKAKLESRPQWQEVNKTVTHPLSIRAKIRDENSDAWGEWKDYGAAEWKHRCSPQVTVQMGGGGNKAGGYQSQEDANKPTVKPILGTKDPASPQMNLKANPVDPKPAADLGVKKGDDDTKGLLLPAIQKAR